jgi:hypothetical protein
MDRIAAIEKSLTCFVCGIVGLLPLLGLFPAVHAVVCWRRVRADYSPEWNPASAYLTGGFVLGLLGVLSSVLFIVVIAAVVMTNMT